MRLILPRPETRILVAAVSLVAACSRPQPPVQPGPQIVADPPAELSGFVEECDALSAALGAWQDCPNLEAEDHQDLKNWVERAQKDFAAGRKANPEANTQGVLAQNCYRARISVEAATQRCFAGPRPKDAW